MRKQHFGIFVLQKLLIITVTNYAADCFIERSLMLWIAEAIDKNEICVSVNGSGTMKIEQLLLYAKLLIKIINERFSDHTDLCAVIYRERTIPL